MKIEIKSWYNGSILFSGEFGSLKLCIEAALKSRAYLSGANLSGANLSRADLSGAYLPNGSLPSGWVRDANGYLTKEPGK